MENGTNGKQQLPFVCCKEKTESANLRLFAANGSGKRKFVFLSRQTVNRNRRLLFEQTPIYATSNFRGIITTWNSPP
jgi:hypothetical protein